MCVTADVGVVGAAEGEPRTPRSARKAVLDDLVLTCSEQSLQAVKLLQVGCAAALFTVCTGAVASLAPSPNPDARGRCVGDDATGNPPHVI